MIVIKIIGFAAGQHCPHAGEFLRTFDFEADHGRGVGTFTHALDRAMKFPSMADALTFWKTSPVNAPVRADGKPNRPLTAATVEIADESAFKEVQSP